MLQPVAHMALHNRWMRRTLLARKTAQVAEGLDEDLAIMWAINDATGQGHFWKHGAAKARQRMQESILLINPARAEFAHVVATELTVQGATGPLRARSYAAPSTRGAAPTIVFFHGGGWVVGDLDTHDELCRHFAARGAVRVIAVDYRCAPEHAFPAAAHDAIAAFRDIAANAAAHQADPKRLAVCGDSAGGNLSAVIANATRDDAIAPALQVLLYPALDAERTAPSHTTHNKGFGLDADSITWYLGNYIGSTPAAGTLRDPLLSPAHASDATLRGVAPAIVEIAGFDPLHDEALAYAQRLRSAGVAVEEHDHVAMVHGFCLMTTACARAWLLTDAICTRVVQRLTQT